LSGGEQFRGSVARRTPRRAEGTIRMGERVASRAATDGTARSRPAAHDRLTAALAVAGALGFLAPGLWAFLAPASFYRWVALFPPYNRHFLHDAGVFQIGLGIALLLALRWRDALFVALLGAGLGGALHAISHLLDRDLGGRPVDAPGLGLLAALLIAAALRRRGVAREGG
jgi:hypothetical protein